MWKLINLCFQFLLSVYSTVTWGTAKHQISRTKHHSYQEAWSFYFQCPNTKIHALYIFATFQKIIFFLWFHRSSKKLYSFFHSQSVFYLFSTCVSQSLERNVRITEVRGLTTLRLLQTALRWYFTVDI